jgi:phage terminase Nu1 subunit (DNA packaging protein)
MTESSRVLRGTVSGVQPGCPTPPFRSPQLLKTPLQDYTVGLELMAVPISQSDFARRHGVSRNAVSRWKRLGYVVVRQDGLVDVERSEALLAGRPLKYRGGTVKGPSAPTDEQTGERDSSSSDSQCSLVEAARRKEVALARLRELELAEKRGELINAAEAERAWSEALANMKARLLTVPARVSSRLPSLSHRDIAAIDAELRQAMNEIADNKQPE